jgi:hypothetical protein
MNPTAALLAIALASLTAMMLYINEISPRHMLPREPGVVAEPVRLAVESSGMVGWD